MTRFNRWTLFAAIVVASIWTASSAAAQDAPKAKEPAAARTDVVVTTNDSTSLQDVQKAAEQLAAAVQEAVRKATEDPAVKVAALKVAKNAVVAAQVVITQQAETLQSVLDSLAKEIAQATEKQRSKSKSH